MDRFWFNKLTHQRFIERPVCPRHSVDTCPYNIFHLHTPQRKYMGPASVSPFYRWARWGPIMQLVVGGGRTQNQVFWLLNNTSSSGMPLQDINIFLMIYGRLYFSKVTLHSLPEPSHCSIERRGLFPLPVSLGSPVWWPMQTECRKMLHDFCGYVIKGNTEWAWLSLSGHWLLEPSCHIMRKTKLRGSKV